MMNTENQKTKLKSKKREKPRSSWILYLYFIPNLLRAGNVIRTEGSLEMLFILRLLMNPNVTYINTDLESVYIEGRDRTYNPDAAFALLDDEALHYNEIKSSRELKNVKTQVKLDQIAQCFAKKSVIFEVLDENDIATGDTGRNLLRLFHFYPAKIKIDIMNQIQSLVNNTRTLESLIRVCDEHRIENSRVAIWNMLAHHYLLVDDLSEYINASTLISVAE